MSIVMAERVGRRIQPVRDTSMATHPTIGYVIHDDDGLFAITARDECEKKDSVTEAVDFIGRRWEGMNR